MTQLYYIEFSDGTGLYMNSDEFDDFARALALLSVHYTAIVVDEPMYAIHWYDYIDDEWSIIWCSPETYDEQIYEIECSDVEHYVEAYNIK